MFRSPVVADPPTHVDPAEQAGNTCTQLIPLSVLELDLAAPESWSAFLADREIEITIDDIGRAAITRTDARRLFDEKREREAHAREHAAVVERQQIEADQRWRASLGVGLPAAAIPHGMTYGEVVASAELDSQQYRPRATLVEDLLGNSDDLTFHSLAEGDES